MTDYLEGGMERLSASKEAKEAMRVFWKAVHNHEEELQMELEDLPGGGIEMCIWRDHFRVDITINGQGTNITGFIIPQDQDV